MKIFLLFLCVALDIFVAGDSDSTLPDLLLEQHFKILSKRRNPLVDDGKSWIEGRKYIKDRMRHYGIANLQEQVFNTSVKGEQFEGVNLIGIAEGANVNNDSVIVVGADYDTNIISNPLKDNTGGVACLLELIHLFYDRIKWNQYSLNYTVIFVAFDLNTKEYHGESMGQPGSHYFVHEWLLPFLNNGTLFRNFTGAIILDSVTTYNGKNDTQNLKDGFDSAFPEAYKTIKESGDKGNFLGFLYTSEAEENDIKKTFTDFYTRDRKLRQFRLQEMEVRLHSDLIGMDVLKMINHQSHFTFWTNLDQMPLPAFLLFDTDDDRTDPTSHICDPVICDVDDFLTKDRIDFMTKTTHSLLNTLLNLSTTQYDEVPDSATVPYSSTIQIMMLSSLSIITALFFK